ncbi:hypothetical protein F5887DRAFT_1164363 [Amanita rubescens]|nr:hypothetical protein F5887DRAFT_1164363 [Amanita rubescens]
MSIERMMTLAHAWADGCRVAAREDNDIRRLSRFPQRNSVTRQRRVTSFKYTACLRCQPAQGYALSRGVLKLSPPIIKSLYNILEVTFDPLTLCTSVAPLLQKLSADEAYTPYLSLLQRALLSRLSLRFSEVYSTVKIDNLNALVKPLKEAGIEGAFDEHTLWDGSITFVDDSYVLTDEPSINPEAKTSASSEGFVQPSMAEFAEKFKSLVTAANVERHALRLRRALVTKRRELLSELRREDLRRKEQERAKKEIDEAKKYAQSLVTKRILKANDVDKLENYDTEGLNTIQVPQLEKEKELNECLRVVSKPIDHIERSKIEEEKEKLRNAVVKAWEEEKRREEEEKRRKWEKEEEERQLEEETARRRFERREEEERPQREGEAKRKEEEEVAERRRQREADRLADLERVRKQQQREEEAEKRGLQRKPFSTPAPAAPVQGGDTWRKAGPPTGPPSRPETPALAERASRLRPGAGGALARKLSSKVAVVLIHLRYSASTFFSAP